MKFKTPQSDVGEKKRKENPFALVLKTVKEMNCLVPGAFVMAELS